MDIGGVPFQNAVQLRKCSFVMLVDEIDLCLQAVGIQIVGVLPYHRIQPGVDLVPLPSAECDNRILQQRVCQIFLCILRHKIFQRLTPSLLFGNGHGTFFGQGNGNGRLFLCGYTGGSAGAAGDHQCRCQHECQHPKLPC